MVVPQAFYDCLAICGRLEKSVGNVAHGEFHLFAYLACLLSLYRKKLAADWGYGFSGTREGAPYSMDINTAIDYLILLGLIEEKENYFTLTDKGREEYASLLQFLTHQEREEFIDGACSSSLVLPMGLIREALYQEPELRHVKKLKSSRILLDELQVSLIHEHFAALSNAIGIEVKDLIVPSVVWLKYLFQTREVESHPDEFTSQH